VVLTGGDGDGSFGVQIIKDKGGQVIAQDRPTSQDFSMPETSIQTGDVDFILPLDEIAPKLMELVERGVQSVREKHLNDPSSSSSKYPAKSRTRTTTRTNRARPRFAAATEPAMLKPRK